LNSSSDNSFIDLTNGRLLRVIKGICLRKVEQNISFCSKILVYFRINRNNPGITPTSPTGLKRKLNLKNIRIMYSKLITNLK
jgi:hypothetical protein